MCDDAIRIRACRALGARVRIGDPMPGQKHQIEFAANLVTRIRRVKRRHESVEPDFITDCGSVEALSRHGCRDAVNRLEAGVVPPWPSICLPRLNSRNGQPIRSDRRKHARADRHAGWARAEQRKTGRQDDSLYGPQPPEPFRAWTFDSDEECGPGQHQTERDEFQVVQATNVGELAHASVRAIRETDGHRSRVPRPRAVRPLPETSTS